MIRPVNRLPMKTSKATQTKWHPGLLVSVRSLAEFELLAGLGVDVIDFKEPHFGPLAAADPALWDRAVDSISLAPTQKLSAALGECKEAIQLASQVPPRFAYAKAGPAGVDSIEHLSLYWEQLRQRLPAPVELVAVAYADHHDAACPEPESIFAAARACEIRTWLLDTFGKGDRQGVVHRISSARFRSLRAMADQAGARWVLAGSIRMDDAIGLASQSIHPDLFGVRGDVCDGSRVGNVVSEKVSRWLELVRSLADDHHHGNDRDGAQCEANVR
jgi:(5-formylfuran-3-yl)methyl phosphate synthase